MPVLQKKIKSDFTTIHNAFLRDKSMGIKERGLLVTMLSLPDGWRFSIKGLMAILPEGDYVIRTTLNNLENLGYLRRVRKNGKDGKMDWEYLFSDEPCFLGSEIQLRSNNKKPRVENPHVAAPQVENPIVENPHANKITNNKIPNNQIFNNQSYQSISSIAVDGQTTLDDGIDMINNHKKSFDRVAYEELIKRNIEYDWYTEAAQNDWKIKERLKTVDEIVTIMLDVVGSTRQTIRVNSEEITQETVKSRFMKIKQPHIDYVIEAMGNNTAEIRNIRSYLITALYNAPSTIENYYQAQVNHDMYGGDDY